MNLFVFRRNTEKKSVITHILLCILHHNTRIYMYRIIHTIQTEESHHEKTFRALLSLSRRRLIWIIIGASRLRASQFPVVNHRQRIYVYVYIHIYIPVSLSLYIYIEDTVRRGGGVYCWRKINAARRLVISARDTLRHYAMRERERLKVLYYISFSVEIEIIIYVYIEKVDPSAVYYLEFACRVAVWTTIYHIYSSIVYITSHGKPTR